MIWVILFIIIFVSSTYLAWKSMKDFQEVPISNFGYTLFLIRNPHSLDLDKLYKFALDGDFIFSLERLFKGEESALVIYAPNHLANSLQELDLVPLEDYLSPPQTPPNPKTVSVNDSYTWMIEPKIENGLDIKQDFLKEPPLNESNRFFWQIVASPINGITHKFQVTIRATVTETIPQKKIELAKKIDQYIQEKTGLKKQEKNIGTSFIYEAFRARNLVPQEVAPFILTQQELSDLLN